MYYPNYYKPSADERIWVQNETSAEAYLVAPNGFVRLWDSNEPKFYERSADASGRPSQLKVFKYEQIMSNTERNAHLGSVDYQEQINAILGRLEALEKGDKHDTEPNADDSTV